MVQQKCIKRDPIFPFQGQESTAAQHTQVMGPNSAMLDRFDFQQREGLDELMQARMQKLLDNQIPKAEQEADQIAQSVVGARTPDEVKAQLGEQMGADFSNVRFHTGANAQTMADSMGARAYTSGQDIYFGSGGFDPGIAAHELVHTAQQGAVESAMSTSAAPMGGVQMKPSWEGFKRVMGNAKTVIGHGLKTVGKGIAKPFKAIGRGISSLFSGREQPPVQPQVAPAPAPEMPVVDPVKQAAAQPVLDAIQSDGRSGEFDQYIATRNARQMALSPDLGGGSHKMRMFLRDTYGMDQQQKDDLYDLYSNPNRHGEFIDRMRAKTSDAMNMNMNFDVDSEEGLLANSADLSAKTTDIMALSDIIKDHNADLGYSDDFVKKDFGSRRQYMMAMKANTRSRLRELTGDAIPGSAEQSNTSQIAFGPTGRNQGFEAFKQRYLALNFPGH